MRSTAIISLMCTACLAATEQMPDATFTDGGVAEESSSSSSAAEQPSSVSVDTSPSSAAATTSAVPEPSSATSEITSSSSAAPSSSSPEPEPLEPMVQIPAGSFWMGCNSLEHCYPDEEPYRQFTISAYRIDKYEVTRERFAECVAAGACPAPDLNLDEKRNHPVVGVTWSQANAYCTWRGKHLPTEAQWERAARGTGGQAYPWGNALPTCEHCNFDNCVGDTTPVGSYPLGASPEGVMDLSGNVWEWTGEQYSESYYLDASEHDPTAPPNGLGYTYRGGHFRSGLERMDLWLRYYPDGTAADDRRPKGFRCAL